MQSFGSVRQQVAMFVDRASLDQRPVPQAGDGAVEPLCAVDDEEFGTPEATPDEIVENGSPSLGRLTAHVPDGEQDLLTVLA